MRQVLFAVLILSSLVARAESCEVYSNYLNLADVLLEDAIKGDSCNVSILNRVKTQNRISRGAQTEKLDPSKVNCFYLKYNAIEADLIKAISAASQSNHEACVRMVHELREKLKTLNDDVSREPHKSETQGPPAHGTSSSPAAPVAPASSSSAQ